MRSSEVFTPGKLPGITYVADHLEARARQLREALDMGAAVISLSGPSKSGKTVFVEKNVGKERLIQVTGAGVTTPAMLWDRVFDIIGTPVRRQQSHTSGHEFKSSAGVSGEGSIGVAKAKGEGSVEGAWSRGDTQHHEYSVDYLQLLIRELGNTGLVVFIDDFHYIPRAVQVEISNQIKEAIRSNVLFIVASVPYHSDDAVRANPDLRGRAVKIDFEYWSPEALGRIAELGFAALNVSASEAYVIAIAREAAGSPQLMQALCLNTCFDNRIEEQQAEPRGLDSRLSAIGNVCGRTALMVDYSSTVEKVKEGPKTRGTDRKAYTLKDGSMVDVYPLILQGVALDPPELTFRYQNLTKRIERLCSKETPSGSSVTGACFHIASIANDSENRTIIEWDGENDVLDVRDPYLLFYLRWGDTQLRRPPKDENHNGQLPLAS